MAEMASLDVREMCRKMTTIRSFSFEMGILERTEVTSFHLGITKSPFASGSLSIKNALAEKRTVLIRFQVFPILATLFVQITEDHEET